MTKIILSTLALLTAGYVAWSGYNFWSLLQKSKQLITSSKAFASTGNGTNILVAGDSTAVGVGASTPEQSIAGRIHQEFPTANIHNIGTSGLRTQQLIDKLQAIPDNQTYQLILLQIGGNDTVRFTDLKQLQSYLNRVLNIARNHTDNVILMTSGNVGAAPIFPAPIQPIYHRRTLQVRQLFRDTAQQHNVTYIDLYKPPKKDPFLKDSQKYFASDYFHPSGAGYDIWYQQLRPALEKALPAP